MIFLKIADSCEIDTDIIPKEIESEKVLQGKNPVNMSDNANVKNTIYRLIFLFLHFSSFDMGLFLFTTGDRRNITILEVQAPATDTNTNKLFGRIERNNMKIK